MSEQVEKALGIYEVALSVLGNSDTARTLTMIAMAETEEAPTVEDALVLPSRQQNANGTTDFGLYQTNSMYYDTESPRYLTTLDPNSRELPEKWRSEKWRSSIFGATMIADFVGRHLDYPNADAHREEGDLDFTEWAAFNNDSYLRFGEVTDEAIARFAELRSGVADSQPSAESSGRPDYRNPAKRVPEFWRRLKAVRDRADIKFTPYSVPSQTVPRLVAQVKNADPALARLLADSSTGFKTNEAAIIDYASDDDLERAADAFRRQGLRVDPETPWIVSMLGGGQIDRNGDVANQLWDKAISSIHTPEDNV